MYFRFISSNEVGSAMDELFVERLLTSVQGGGASLFIRELEDLLDGVKVHGAVNSLAQLVLKTTCPGVPDFYQGCELWDLSLVDPDNRRPVDFGRRSDALEELQSMSKLDGIRRATDDLASGHIKLLTMQRALSTRNNNLQAIMSGSYTPLSVSAEDHLFAYMRGEDLIVVIPRFTLTPVDGQSTWPIGACWKTHTVSLPQSSNGSWVNTLSGQECDVIGGEELKASEAFAHIPVAILSRQHECSAENSIEANGHGNSVGL